MLAIIIPGNGNTDINSQWYQWAKKELEKMGMDVIAENMPDPDLARKEYWLPWIEEKTKRQEDVILIGHSSGATAIMRYLENHKTFGAVLVGASYTDLNLEKERASHYYDEPWQWDKIKQNAKWILLFASADDPYITIKEFRFIRDRLDPGYHEYYNKGHFTDVNFPELIEAIRKRI